MRSIIQSEKECYVCRSKAWLEEHHVFEGTANRKLSEKYGLKIWLCHRHHNEPPSGIHFDKELRERIKSECQIKCMRYWGINVEEFIRIFGKNYIEVKK